jgi:hypothetical protein
LALPSIGGQTLGNGTALSPASRRLWRLSSSDVRYVPTAFTSAISLGAKQTLACW